MAAATQSHSILKQRTQPPSLLLALIFNMYRYVFIYQFIKMTGCGGPAAADRSLSPLDDSREYENISMRLFLSYRHKETERRKDTFPFTMLDVTLLMLVSLSFVLSRCVSKKVKPFLIAFHDQMGH